VNRYENLGASPVLFGYHIETTECQKEARIDGLLSLALHTHDRVSLAEEAVEKALYRVPVMTGDEDVVISQRRQEEGIE